VPDRHHVMNFLHQLMKILHCTSALIFCASCALRSPPLRVAAIARQETMTPIDALYRQANDHPDTVAFISGNDTWTYCRLAAEVERVAQALLARGLQSGDRVALQMPNRPELAIAYYACFRIGA